MPRLGAGAVGTPSSPSVDAAGIDPDLFFDDDGKVYIISSTFTLFEIDPESGELLSEGRKIWASTGGRYAEGPHL